MRKLVLLPFFLILGLAFYFIYIAVGWNALVSVSQWSGLRVSYAFSGFEHYTELFDDPVFWTSLKNTFLLFLLIPICMGLGLLLAILLDRSVRGEKVFRNLYLLPFALSFVVTATLWAWMYSPSIGVANSILRLLGLGSLAGMWHTTKDSVMWSILLALIWQFSGYTMMIFLAGIRSVPEDQVWAAAVDGASTSQLYARVIVPQLGPSFLTSFVVLVLFSLKAFDFIWVLTSGGPGTASHTLPVMMYRVTFEQTEFAYGAAVSVVLLAVVLAIVVPYLYLSYRRK
mgnify:CR=1 FL=1